MQKSVSGGQKVSSRRVSSSQTKAINSVKPLAGGRIKSNTRQATGVTRAAKRGR